MTHMPGFTADASIYKRLENYEGVAAFSDTIEGRIVPSQTKLWPFVSLCRDTDCRPDSFGGRYCRRCCYSVSCKWVYYHPPA
jgi:hypothetical protein